MNKLTLLILLIFPSFDGVAYSVDTNYQVLRPFGFPNRQPPSSNSVKIVDFKLGLESQQVCGYTDWTTASITVPKHLLSKQYWKGKLGQVKDKAVGLIHDISGALPGMLACNVSPTWCNILNKNQMLAAFESQLTFDTCQMLDGVANIDNLQATELKNCIREKTSTDHTITAGQAREECLVNPNDTDGATSKMDKIGRSRQSGNSFSMAELLSDLFPEKVKASDGTTISMNSGGKAYSRRSESLRLSKVLFPGLEISGSITTVVGGTFQPTVEQELASNMSELETAIVEVMKEMIKLRNQGNNPKQIIAKASKIWNDKRKWEKNKKPHPFFRATPDGVTPSFLVTPEQVLSLIPLADTSNPQLLTPELRQIIDRITRSISTIKLADNISDIHTRSLDVCKKSPKYQDALSQKNCDLILERTRTSLDILHLTRENEEKARLAQAEVSNLINSIQHERSLKYTRPSIAPTSINSESMGVPWR